VQGGAQPAAAAVRRLEWKDGKSSNGHIIEVYLNPVKKKAIILLLCYNLIKVLKDALSY
jgi:hypothetical protein